MSAEAQKYKGVSVDNPRIVEYSKNMIKGGSSDEQISRVVGMPVEVIQSIRRDVERSKS